MHWAVPRMHTGMRDKNKRELLKEKDGLSFFFTKFLEVGQKIVTEDSDS